MNPNDDPNEEEFYNCILCVEKLNMAVCVAHKPKNIVCTSQGCPGAYVCGTKWPLPNCIRMFVRLDKPTWNAQHRRLVFRKCGRLGCEGFLTTEIRDPPQHIINMVNNFYRPCRYPGCGYTSTFNSNYNHSVVHELDEESENISGVEAPTDDDDNDA
ncbi:unnamed protein product [Amaranthus hypochondriacus]